jgi:hypothetical protein
MKVSLVTELSLISQGLKCVCVCLFDCVYEGKVAGSIPDGVMEFCIDINPSDRSMALGSTQPQTEMSTRCISWG